MKIKYDADIFAPGNLRLTTIHSGYRKCVLWYMDKGKRLRYTGGMAPDIYQIFIKKNGIFMYPGAPPHIAKLRLLY